MSRTSRLIMAAVAAAALVVAYTLLAQMSVRDVPQYDPCRDVAINGSYISCEDAP